MTLKASATRFEVEMAVRLRTRRAATSPLFPKPRDGTGPHCEELLQGKVQRGSAQGARVTWQLPYSLYVFFSCNPFLLQLFYSVIFRTLLKRAPSFSF